MTEGIVTKDGSMYGGWRQPINVWADLPGSIHNDAVASKIGMRGGTIPGTVHFNLFSPLFLKLWGRRWWEQGTISMYYTYATKHKEDVRAIVKVPADNTGDVETEAWVETPNGQIVCRGTVSIGKPGEGYVRKLEVKNSTQDELRILADVKPGTEIPECDMTVTEQSQDKGLETNTDPLDIYKTNSPWGFRVLPPTSLYRLLNAGFPKDSIKQPAVGFFGATEIRVFKGPIKVGVTYRSKSKVIAVGVTEKTEYAWVDSWMHNEGTDELVA
ncbi:hypothetical protein ES703_101983 [subsurface metagenome]